MNWWRRLRWALTPTRRRREIGERECRHNGTQPMCEDCWNHRVGW